MAYSVGAEQLNSLYYIVRVSGLACMYCNPKAKLFFSFCKQSR